MDTINTNPILPAPGVSRNLANNTETSHSSSVQNNDNATNCLQQGVLSESGRLKANLLRCKETVILGTFYNTNSLRDEDKQLELEHCACL